jgi:hypothetical protein
MTLYADAIGWPQQAAGSMELAYGLNGSLISHCSFILRFKGEE